MQSMDDFQGAPFTAAMLFAVGICVDREMLVNNILPTRPMFLDGSMLQFLGSVALTAATCSDAKHRCLL